MKININKAYKNAIKKNSKVIRSFKLDKSVSDNLTKYCKKNLFYNSAVVNEALKKWLKNEEN